MAIASVLLGVASLLMMFGGIFLFWMPAVGSVLSFGGPVLALVGIVLGGLAMSRAKQEGAPSGAALAGVILNVVGFLFGLVVAMTCGLCNAACTTAMMNGRAMDGGTGWQLQVGPDGGLGAPMMPGPSGPVGPTDTTGSVPTPPPGAGGAQSGAPPPAFPPPPPGAPPSQPQPSLAPPPPGAASTPSLAPPPP